MIKIEVTDKDQAVYLELESLAYHEFEQLKSMAFGLAFATITSDEATYDPNMLTSSLFHLHDFIEAIQNRIKDLSDLALKDKKEHSEMVEHLVGKLNHSTTTSTEEYLGKEVKAA